LRESLGVHTPLVRQAGAKLNSINYLSVEAAFFFHIFTGEIWPGLPQRP
jgi:hypothetical protein